MRPNLSADSRGEVIGERSGANVEPNKKLESCSANDQSSVPERRHSDKHNDHPSFTMRRYLNDAINPFNAFALRQDSSAAPSSRTAMETYTRAWEVEFEEATRKNEATERSV